MDEEDPRGGARGSGGVGGPASGPAQGELPFDAPGARGDGYATWQERRRAAMTEAGRRLGLPLGHPVRIELKDGCQLRGVLRLAEEGLFLEVGREPGHEPMLRVDRCTFGLTDIASCVREG